MNTRIFPKNLIIPAMVCLAMLIAFAQAANVSAQVTGAVFTTDSSCTGVDLNIYSSKDAVYLDGGPRHPGAAGLLPGDYYVKVTEPNGTLLGTSVGAAVPQPVHVDANGDFTGCYQLSSILIRASNGMPGYDSTSNPGGEYKAWASMDATFANRNSKTDNFKVKDNCETHCIPPALISGLKFNDSNMSGTYQEDTEPIIPGWHIELYFGGVKVNETDTDADGAFQFLVDFHNGDVYTVKEIVQTGWQAVTPTERTVTLVLNGMNPVLLYPNNNFGNIRLFDIGGVKYNDVNMSGTPDVGEAGVAGVTVNVGVTYPNATKDMLSTSTGIGGVWSLTGLPDGTTFTACEVVPAGWITTTSACLPLATVTANIANANFFNIRVFNFGGVKYYDADMNGSFSMGDTPLTGIKILIAAILPNGTMDGQTLYSGVGGVWVSKLFPEGTTYTVSEVLPNGAWSQVASRNLTGSIDGANSSADFLNVCSITPGGHTLGFWSNKNGLALITSADLTRLNGYDLRVASGADAPTFTTASLGSKGSFNNWLLTASATNMAYMLSVQMTATDLSVAHGFSDPNIVVDGTKTVSQLITYANSLLANPIASGSFAGQDGSYTVASTSLRTEQGRVKDILDKINNGGSFPQGLPCAFTTPY